MCRTVSRMPSWADLVSAGDVQIWDCSSVVSCHRATVRWTRTAGAKLTDLLGRCEDGRDEDMMEVLVRVVDMTEGGCLARTCCLLKVFMGLLPVLGENEDGMMFSGMTDAGMLLSFSSVWDG